MALPHRLTSPQMPIYCTWQPRWSRGTSGVDNSDPSRKRPKFLMNHLGQVSAFSLREVLGITSLWLPEITQGEICRLRTL
ncbi:hypothetical protein AV530_006329 [Patagioenas fasciata monilis]|uniref:Uncharacterized protein n=1 Tax=Patagioenas fasciata monilis TaxID=372326 RepID=A0A1V4KHY1_PATFA|nr:hypothetical protein AV530_006329 [Patagioenas fasciata monilis]